MDYWDKSVATNVSACACVCAHCSNTANTRATPLWLQLHQVANWNSRNLLTETQINQVRFCLPLNFICFHFCWFSLLSHSSQWKIIYNLLWTVLFFANVRNFPLSYTVMDTHTQVQIYQLWNVDNFHCTNFHASK